MILPFHSISRNLVSAASALKVHATLWSPSQRTDWLAFSRAMCLLAGYFLPKLESIYLQFWKKTERKIDIGRPWNLEKCPLSLQFLNLGNPTNNFWEVGETDGRNPFAPSLHILHTQNMPCPFAWMGTLQAIKAKAEFGWGLQQCFCLCLSLPLISAPPTACSPFVITWK